jgi:tetratricopeptide (TPR) repeat protein
MSHVRPLVWLAALPVLTIAALALAGPAAAVLLILAASARADDATDALDQLYGDDLKRVLATPSPADDVALAKQLLDAAKKVSNQVAFLTVLCEKAYELAAKDASGYPTATAAMDLLAETVGDKKADCLQKCVALYQKQYAAARGDAKVKAGETLTEALGKVAEVQAATGDVDGAAATLRQAIAIATAIRSDTKAALQAQLDGLAPQAKMEKQLAALKAKLDAKPDDAAARKELVRLYLVELDNPAEAAKFVDESLDEATRKYVPAAVKPIQEAPELACRELGEWYRGLADQAAAQAGKGAMLRRAQGYYERFVGLHTTDDLARTTATLALNKIEDALAKLPANKALPGMWIDCLKLVAPAKHGVAGKWERKDQGLVVAPGQFSRLTIPVAPTGHYEVKVVFVRTNGDGAVLVALPVGPTACGLVLSAARGHSSGLEAINGNWAGDGANETAVRPGTLVNGQEYSLDIKVMLQGQQAEIATSLDDRPFVHWKGALSALSTFPDWRTPDPKCLGLGAHLSAVEFRRVRMRALSGELKLPDANPATASPAPTRPTPKG